MLSIRSSTPRRSSRSRLALAAVALSAALVAAPLASPANASDGNWWYSALGVDDAAAQGFTGTGVKIAVIDGGINPDVPVFEGANLTVSDVENCGPAVRTDAAAEHGTAVTSLIIAQPTNALPMRGIAPDASVTFYTDGAAVDEDGARERGGVACENPDWEGPNGSYAMTTALNAAIDDGADIISWSAGGPWDDASIRAVARATAEGIIIVAGTRNDYSTSMGSFPAGMNGVVAVGSVDANTELQTLEYGKDGVDEITSRDFESTVVGPGVDIASMDPVSGTLMVREGTSLATPIVAGALALAKQKYPDATANQLVQALIRSTIAAQRGHFELATDGFGYGAIDVAALLETDPATYPDENPLMYKFIARPTPEEFAEAAREVGASPSDSETSPAPEPTSDAAATSHTSSPASLAPVIIGAGAAVAIIVAIAVVIIVINRRRAKS